MKTYVVTYRYEGSFEVRAFNPKDAEEQAERFSEQKLLLRLGDVEMDPPVEKGKHPLFRSGLLADLQGGREA